jgi:ABC-type nitrate/sulfonate/bicarbonate transport system ATPase subunit
VIEVRSVCYDFATSKGPRPVLRDVGLDVAPGRILAVVGPSGCGKTTLLRLLTGHLEPTSGHVELDGVPPGDKPGRAGVLFQDHYLLPWRTVEENVRLPLEVQHRLDDKSLLYDLLLLMGLGEYASEYPARLSGGLKERTALARALVTSPRFLLMDEPLGSTDYIHRIRIEDHLKSLVRRESLCLVVVTHELEQAIALADEILILGFASVRAQSSHFLRVPSDLRDKPSSRARVSPMMTAFLPELLDAYRRVVQ